MVHAEGVHRLGQDVADGAGPQTRIQAQRALRLQRDEAGAKPLGVFADGGERVRFAARGAQQREEVQARRPPPLALQHQPAGELRGQHDRLAQEGLGHGPPQAAGVLGVASGIGAGHAVAEQITLAAQHGAVRAEALAVRPHRVAEDVQGRAEPDGHGRVQPHDLHGEVRDAAELGELVVLDDVARLTGLAQEVLDERLGLEHQRVVDGHGHDEDGALVSPLEAFGRGLERAAEQAELELALDLARAGPRAPREEQAVIAALQEHLAVGLQDLFVEGVAQPAIDPVRAQVAHEVADQRVAEEVLAGAVGHRGQLGLHQRPAEHDAVHVARVGGHDDQRALLGQPADRRELTLDADALGQVPKRVHARQGAQLGEPLHAAGQIRALEQKAEAHGQDLGGHVVDAFVEVALHVLDVVRAEPHRLVAQLVRGHAPQSTGEALPAFELLGVGPHAVFEPVDLPIGGVVEHELEAARRLDPPETGELRDRALHDLAFDVSAVTIELENGRVHGGAKIRQHVDDRTRERDRLRAL